MILKQCRGYELEKVQSNSPEDFFARSEVTFLEEGMERTLYVLYVKYFEEQAKEFLPYSKEPLFTVGSREIYLKDIIALIYLLQYPEAKSRKRIYVSKQQDFSEYLKNADYEEIEKMMQQLEHK